MPASALKPAPLLIMEDTAGTFAFRKLSESKFLNERVSTVPNIKAYKLQDPISEGSSNASITRRVPFSSHLIAKNGLQILCELHGLDKGPTNLRDAVLIPIDFENIRHIKGDLSLNLESKVGLAFLDTRNIGLIQPDKLISTYNFVSGPSSYQELRKDFDLGTLLPIIKKICFGTSSHYGLKIGTSS